ncbi:hypothetical protein N474_23930 [Pseudoalteromonas luteoviolacea CPMOR-2]|uniref:Uncharacterized protein n=1 Tax=Pseudoalteromonas luteoviolacea DSM 6061 TaxID=1365250 RepID=A0A166UKB6_9GAMM|nr:hypothetical protein N475_05055 [Pseudoalteromonas luteoviolacea DSM 6061]KZN51724.1 hypothetical protein N474_23930 [Pseudoalteromonas luteoviolacea CPMOR-2]
MSATNLNSKVSGVIACNVQAQNYTHNYPKKQNGQSDVFCAIWKPNVDE